MAFDKDEEALPLWSEDLLPSEEPRGFAPEQMVCCDVCLRANPPTRSACLYCAAVLPVTETSRSLRLPTIRRLEKWERGVNCILMPTPHVASLPEDKLAEAAQLLRLDAATLKAIANGGEPLPLARVATPDDAALIKDRLAAHGFDVLNVDDEALALESAPPVRLRAFKFAENALTAYPSGGGQERRVSWGQVSLLVTGRIFKRRIEVEERRRVRGAEAEILDAREYNTDETMLDIYVTHDQNEWESWRISGGNFDFSCLGDEKGLLTPQNFHTLIAALQSRVPAMKLCESYHRVRHLLVHAWPLEQHTDSRGWHRERPGKYSTESVTTSDNDKQFMLYSRLQQHLSSRGLNKRNES